MGRMKYEIDLGKLVEINSGLVPFVSGSIVLNEIRSVSWHMNPHDAKSEFKVKFWTGANYSGHTLTVKRKDLLHPLSYYTYDQLRGILEKRFFDGKLDTNMEMTTLLPYSLDNTPNPRIV